MRLFVWFGFLKLFSRVAAITGLESIINVFSETVPFDLFEIFHDKC